MPARLVLLLPLLAVAAGALCSPARAAEDVDALLREFEVVARRRDERGYREQQDVLIRLEGIGTPAARAGLRGILDRHGKADARTASLVLAALARRASPDEMDDLLAWVEGRRDPLLVEQAGEVVAAAEDPATRAHLRGSALRRATPPFKAQIARGLGLAGDGEAVAALLLLLREMDRRVRVEALGALGALADPKATGAVLVFLRNPDPAIRDAAARALAGIADPRAAGPLEDALEDEDPRVVESAALALGRLEAVAAIPRLIARLEALADADLRVADAVAEALSRITGKTFGPDPEPWRSWWEVVKDRPFERPRAPGEGRTVAGARYYGFPVRSSRVVFVLDVSRSMGWNDRLESAKAELAQVLGDLPETTRFNLVTYSDAAQAWREGLAPATPANVRRAMAFVRRQRPDNGTNTYHALQVAFENEEADTVFFLSDGHPTVGVETLPDRILMEVARWNRYRRVRIHCVSLVRGDPPTRWAGYEDVPRAVAFMQRLADAHDGRLKVIR